MVSSTGHLQTIRRTEYDRIPEDRPHIAIQHILDMSNPLFLKSTIKNINLWRKNKQLYKSGFNANMRVAVMQPKQLQQKTKLLTGERKSEIMPEDEIRHTDEAQSKNRFRKLRRVIRVNQYVTPLKRCDKQRNKRETIELSLLPCLNNTVKNNGRDSSFKNAPTLQAPNTFVYGINIEPTKRQLLSFHLVTLPRPSQTNNKIKKQGQKPLTFLSGKITQTRKAGQYHKKNASTTIKVFKKNNHVIYWLKLCPYLHRPSKSCIRFCSKATVPRSPKMYFGQGP